MNNIIRSEFDSCTQNKLVKKNKTYKAKGQVQLLFPSPVLDNATSSLSSPCFVQSVVEPHILVFPRIYPTPGNVPLAQHRPPPSPPFPWFSSPPPVLSTDSSTETCCPASYQHFNVYFVEREKYLGMMSGL